MSEKLHQIISRVFNVDKNRISDETSSENLENFCANLFLADYFCIMRTMLTPVMVNSTNQV